MRYKSMSCLFLAVLMLIMNVFLFGACDSKNPPPNLDGDTSGTVPENPPNPGQDEDDDDIDMPEQPPQSPDETPEEPEKPSPPPDPPKPKQDIMLKSNTDGLTIRSGAGANYSAVGTINKNDLVAYMGENGGWYQTAYKGKTAYISKTYTSMMYFDLGRPTAELAIQLGKQLLGIPYVLGAERLHYGNGIFNSKFTGESYDCSSFVQYIYYMSVKIVLKTTTRDQSVQGITTSNLQRGDLMFFTNASRYHLSGIERIGHVGIYFGNNYILHTASDYSVIEPISTTRWSYLITTQNILG